MGPSLLALALAGLLAAVPDGGTPEPASSCGATSTETPRLPDDLQEVHGAALEALRQRILEIDRAFSSNDRARLAAVLADDAPGPRRTLERELRRALEGASILTQRTEIVRAVRIGETSAVYALVTTLLRPKPATGFSWGFDRQASHGLVLFFRAGSKGGPALARLEHWDETQVFWALGGAIRCEACGWSLPRPTGWFVVPRGRRQGTSFDSVSFVHPDVRVSVDFDCYANPKAERSLAIAERDQEVLNQMVGARGSAVAVVSRGETQDSTGERAALVVDVAGLAGREAMRFERDYRSAHPFLFAFVARGERSALEALGEGPRALASSLELVRSDLSPDERLERVARAHMEGTSLEGVSFTDKKLGISIDGPEGWAARLQPGVGRFCVRFTPPGEDPATTSTSCTAFAWEGESSSFGESEIVRFFENRRASQCDSEYREFESLRRDTREHCNGVDVTYRVESAWVHAAPSGPLPMRELFVAIPLGRHLLAFVARAPREDFEGRLAQFERAIGSLRHAVAR